MALAPLLRSAAVLDLCEAPSAACNVGVGGLIIPEKGLIQRTSHTLIHTAHNCCHAQVYYSRLEKRRCCNLCTAGRLSLYRCSFSTRLRCSFTWSSDT